MERKKTNFRIDSALLDEFRRYTEERGITQQAVIEDAIRRLIHSDGRSPRELLEDIEMRLANIEAALI